MTNDHSASTLARANPSSNVSSVDQPVANPITVNAHRLWIGFVFVLAVLLRILATLGDLELDEVWTILEVKQFVTKLVQIFGLRHDNNHLLNTIIVYLLGPGLPGLCYRIPALLASVGTLGLAGRIAMRRGGTASALLALLLVGFSYLLVLYGTEARGYSYALLFSYLSWLSLQRVDAERRWFDALVFGCSAGLGFSAHLTFLYAYAGFCLWTIWKWIRRPTWVLLFAHALPVTVAVLLYLCFIRGMIIGGGPPIPVYNGVVEAMSIFIGGPFKGEWNFVFAAIAALFLATSFLSVWNSDRATACFYLTVIVIAPATVLLVSEHTLIYPRYFLIPAAFGLLMISEGLSSIWRAKGVWRILVTIFCAVYLVGNLWWNMLLLDHGRGDYSGALKWMSDQSKDSEATVSSDHDFRNHLMYKFYAEHFPPGQFHLTYVLGHSVPPQGTNWHIRHNFEGDKPIPSVVTDSTGIAYRLKRTYKHHGLTGWNWWIYQRIEKAPASKE